MDDGKIKVVDIVGFFRDGKLVGWIRKDALKEISIVEMAIRPG